MLHKKTLLVLGAGASRFFGYPTGKGLVDVLTDEQDPISNRIWNVIRQLNGNNDQQIRAFRNSLRFAAPPSIDWFLSQRADEFMQLGKWAISAALIMCENEHKLFRPYNEKTDEGNWYIYLSQLLPQSLDAWIGHKLDIITFNYDRSLEHFFYTALTHRYPKEEDKVLEAVKNINIVHIHGHVGALPHQKWLDTSPRTYGVSESPDAVSYAAQTLSIQSETTEESECVKKARQMISDAKRIVFLGYGFLRENMTLLGPMDDRGNRILASCFGITPSEATLVNRCFPSGNIVQPGLNILNCNEFLRHNVGKLTEQKGL